MTTDELMRLSADKAIRECSWDSIKWLFRPANMLELLLRLDFDGMKQKICDWCGDDSPEAMPYRFRGPYISKLTRAIEREEFWRTLVIAHESPA